MKKNLLLFTCFFLLPFLIKAQSPSVELFKQVFDAEMQKLLSPGFTRRTMNFIKVTPGTSSGGYYPFKVTAYVHDYAPGYPKNKYYGQTCLGKMEGWKFDMRKDEFGDWILQGRFTVTDGECKDNPSEGAEAIPLSGVPGIPYRKTNIADKTNKTIFDKSSPSTSRLYLGEYACYGTGGRLMAGMGFHLLSNRRYYDLDKQRGGTYIYHAANATITFAGGFLSGQIGKNVKQTGFQLSNTVTAEPWR